MKKGILILGGLAGAGLLAWAFTRKAQASTMENRQPIDITWIDGIGSIGASFQTGEIKNATVPVEVSADLIGKQNEIELFLGIDDTHKVATSGKLRYFIGQGTPVVGSPSLYSENVGVSINMPSTQGTYHVYVNMTINGHLYGFQATEDVTVSSPPVVPPVVVLPPQILLFSASPAQINVGEAVNISLEVKSEVPVTLTIDPLPKYAIEVADSPPQGSTIPWPPASDITTKLFVDDPEVNTTYTLTATNSAGSVSAQVTVGVTQVDIGPVTWGPGFTMQTPTSAFNYSGTINEYQFWGMQPIFLDVNNPGYWWINPWASPTPFGQDISSGGFYGVVYSWAVYRDYVLSAATLARETIPAGV